MYQSPCCCIAVRRSVPIKGLTHGAEHKHGTHSLSKASAWTSTKTIHLIIRFFFPSLSVAVVLLMDGRVVCLCVVLVSPPQRHDYTTIISRNWLASRRHTTDVVNTTMSVNNRFWRSHSVDDSCGLTPKRTGGRIWIVEHAPWDVWGGSEMNGATESPVSTSL